jgi:hypothetical protein
VPWSTYSGTLGAERPAFLPRIEDPEGCAKVIATALNWMQPLVTLSADSFEISLTMDAPSAEAALHHMRGSLKSALYTARIPIMGNWPLTVLKVEPSTGRGQIRMPARDRRLPFPLRHD